MKKTIFTALLLAFSFASFADDNDGVGNKPLKDLICQKFSLFCTKPDQYGMGRMTTTNSTGKNRDDNNRPASIPVFSSNTENASQTRPRGSWGQTGNQIIQGSS